MSGHDDDLDLEEEVLDTGAGVGFAPEDAAAASTASVAADDDEPRAAPAGGLDSAAPAPAASPAPKEVGAIDDFDDDDDLDDLDDLALDAPAAAAAAGGALPPLKGTGAASSEGAASASHSQSGSLPPLAGGGSSSESKVLTRKAPSPALPSDRSNRPPSRLSEATNQSESEGASHAWTEEDEETEYEEEDDGMDLPPPRGQRTATKKRGGYATTETEPTEEEEDDVESTEEYDEGEGDYYDDDDDDEDEYEETTEFEQEDDEDTEEDESVEDTEGEDRYTDDDDEGTEEESVVESTEGERSDHEATETGTDGEIAHMRKQARKAKGDLTPAEAAWAKLLTLLRPLPLDYLKEFGTMPGGFRPSTLAHLEGRGRHRPSSALEPQVARDGLRFRDLGLDSKRLMRPRYHPTAFNVTMTVARDIPPPGPDAQVLSRRVRMVLFDTRHRSAPNDKTYLSNVHTVPAVVSKNSGHEWRFNKKTSIEQGAEGTCMVRMDVKPSPHVCILFELCIVVQKLALSNQRRQEDHIRARKAASDRKRALDSAKPASTTTSAESRHNQAAQHQLGRGSAKGGAAGAGTKKGAAPADPFEDVDVPPKPAVPSTQRHEVRELSVGWGVFPLYESNGELSALSGSHEVVLHGGTPFDEHIPIDIDYEPEKTGLFGKKGRGIAALSFKFGKLSRDTIHAASLLPDTILTAPSTLPLLTIYRQYLADALLHQLDNPLRIRNEPALTGFRRILDIPDALETLKALWEVRAKKFRAADKNNQAFVRAEFRRLVLWVASLGQVASLPPAGNANDECVAYRRVFLDKFASTDPIDSLGRNINAAVYAPFDARDVAFEAAPVIV